MPKTLPVELFKVQKLRAIVGSLGKRTASDGRMHKDDKIATLTMIKEMRTVLDEWLQLGLFSQSQLRSEPTHGTPTQDAEPIPT